MLKYRHQIVFLKSLNPELLTSIKFTRTKMQLNFIVSRQTALRNGFIKNN